MALYKCLLFIFIYFVPQVQHSLWIGVTFSHRPGQETLKMQCVQKLLIRGLIAYVQDLKADQLTDKQLDAMALLSRNNLNSTVYAKSSSKQILIKSMSTYANHQSQWPSFCLKMTLAKRLRNSKKKTEQQLEWWEFCQLLVIINDHQNLIDRLHVREIETLVWLTDMCRSVHVTSEDQVTQTEIASFKHKIYPKFTLFHWNKTSSGLTVWS